MKQTAFKCNICSDYIVGTYHELITCKCNKCYIDVGTMNYRVLGDFQYAKDNWTEFFLEKDSSINEIREKVLWGNYGVDEYGISLLNIWTDKMPQKAKDFYANPFRNWDDFIEKFLSKKEYKKYLDWEKTKPKKNYALMKDMESSHILNILKTQSRIKDNLNAAFRLELKSRGIDTSSIS
jgi:hypothetical protein